MHENPYSPPEPQIAAPGARKTWAEVLRAPVQIRWRVVAWPLAFFLLGTMLVASLVLSADPRVRMQGGVIFGGVPGALIGLAVGYIASRANARQRSPASTPRD
jgi:hypothetical protein